MATTYTLISSNVLTGSAASVTFSSIPSTYTDLVLRVSMRTDEAGQPNNDALLTFNGSTATNYSLTTVYGYSTTSGSQRLSTQANIARNWVDAAGATSNTFASGEIYIPSYTVSQNKPISGIFVTENNASTASSAVIAANAGLWSQTATISSITITAQATTNFVSGSSFYLYGISKS